MEFVYSILAMVAMVVVAGLAALVAMVVWYLRSDIWRRLLELVPEELVTVGAILFYLGIPIGCALLLVTECSILAAVPTVLIWAWVCRELGVWVPLISMKAVYLFAWPLALGVFLMVEQDIDARNKSHLGNEWRPLLLWVPILVVDLARAVFRATRRVAWAK